MPTTPLGRLSTDDRYDRAVYTVKIKFKYLVILCVTVETLRLILKLSFRNELIRKLICFQNNPRFCSKRSVCETSRTARESTTKANVKKSDSHRNDVEMLSMPFVMCNGMSCRKILLITFYSKMSFRVLVYVNFFFDGEFRKQTNTFETPPVI